MSQSTQYEIVETRHATKEKTTLDFKGTFEEAKRMALEKARQNIGVRYSVFRQGSSVAEFQAYYRTTIKCPRCGEVIPLE